MNTFKTEADRLQNADLVKVAALKVKEGLKEIPDEIDLKSRLKALEEEEQSNEIFNKAGRLQKVEADGLKKVEVGEMEKLQKLEAESLQWIEAERMQKEFAANLRKIEADRLKEVEADMQNPLLGKFQIKDYRGKFLIPSAPSMGNLFNTNILDLMVQSVSRVTLSDLPHSNPWKIAKSVKCPGSYTISTIFDGKLHYWQTSLNTITFDNLCLMDGNPHDWESFNFQKEGSHYTIKSVCNDLFICSNDGKMVVDRAEPREWEQFDLVEV